MIRNNTINKFKISVKIFITMICIYLFFSYVEWRELGIMLSSIKITYIVIPSMFLCIAFVLYGLRWLNIVKVITSTSVSNRKVLNTYFESLLFGVVTPGSLGADAYRISQNEKMSLSRTEVIASIIVEKFGGFLIFVGLSLLFVSRSYLSDLFFYSMLIGTLSFCAILFFVSPKLFTHLKLPNSCLSSNKNYAWVNDISQAGLFFVKNPSSMTIFLLISLACVATFALGLGALASALDYQWVLFELFLLVGSIEFLRQLPVTFQGVGVREGLFSVSAVELWGWSLEEGVLVSGIFYILVMLILGLIGSFASIKSNFSAFDS